VGVIICCCIVACIWAAVTGKCGNATVDEGSEEVVEEEVVEEVVVEEVVVNND